MHVTVSDARQQTAYVNHVSHDGPTWWRWWRWRVCRAIHHQNLSISRALCHADVVLIAIPSERGSASCDVAAANEVSIGFSPRRAPCIWPCVLKPVKDCVISEYEVGNWLNGNAARGRAINADRLVGCRAVEVGQVDPAVGKPSVGCRLQ